MEDKENKTNSMEYAEDMDLKAENQVSIIGLFFKDPQVRLVATGGKRAHFMLVVPRTFKKRKGEQLGEVTFVPVVAWGALAERCESLKKGNIVRIMGKLRTWKGDDGKYRWQVSANTLQVMEPMRSEAPKNENDKEPSKEGVTAASA